MEALVRRQVGRLHDSQGMTVLAIAGGGVNALSWLLAAPGASRTVLEAQVPYSASALAQFLGYVPEKVVDPVTARDMARIAYERAWCLSQRDGPVVGIGSTSALSTDRRRRGGHGGFVSAWTAHDVSTYRLELGKGLRDRREEDRVVSMVVLRALAEASDVEFDLPIKLSPGELLEVERSPHTDLIARLLAGEVRTVTVRPDGAMEAGASFRGGVLSGSFDPLHRGHEALAEAASSILREAVLFEMSAANVDKPDLAPQEIRSRVERFAGRWPVVLTRAPTFRLKAGLFPGCTFVIGWDTAVRLLEPRYYGGDEGEMLAALAEIREAGCRFLVAGRLHQGTYHTLDYINVPEGFEEMLASIPEEMFRHDVSSTELRAASR